MYGCTTQREEASHKEQARTAGNVSEKSGRTLAIVSERFTVCLADFMEDDTHWSHLSPDTIKIQKATILLHACRGLAKLHEANVLLRTFGRWQISLAGAASDGLWKLHIADPDAPLTMLDSPAHTIDRGGETETFHYEYASPEVWEGTGIGLQADIYCLGILAWEVWTRCRAWHWLWGQKPQSSLPCQQPRDTSPGSHITPVFLACC
eukprot:COSAG03_NODE_4485_length_1535_cov_5.140759_1_plen_206_part_10